MAFHSTQEDGNESSDEDDSFFTPLRALAASVKQSASEGDPVVAQVIPPAESVDHDRGRPTQPEGHRHNAWSFQWHWISKVQSKSAPEQAAEHSSSKEPVIATQSEEEEEAFNVSSNGKSIIVGMAEVASTASSISAADEACMSMPVGVPSEALSVAETEAELIAQGPQKGVLDPITCLGPTGDLVSDDSEAALDQILPDPIDEHLRQGNQGQVPESDLLSESNLDIVDRAAAQGQVEQRELEPEVEGLHDCDTAVRGEPESMATELCGPQISSEGFCRESSDVDLEVSVSVQDQETSPTVHSRGAAVGSHTPDWLDKDDAVEESMSSDSADAAAETFPGDLQLRLEVAESAAQEALEAFELEQSLRLMAEDGITALEFALASSRSELAQVRAQARADAGKMLERSSMEYHALEGLRSEQIRRERAEEAFCQMERWMRATLEHVRHLRANEDVLQDQIQVLLQQRNQWWDNRWQTNEQQAMSPPQESQSPDLRGMLEGVAASARGCNIPIATPTSPHPQDGPSVAGEGEGEGSWRSRVGLLHSSSGVLRYSRSSSLFHSASADPFQVTPEPEVSRAGGEQRGKAQTLPLAEDKRSPAFAHFQHREQGRATKSASPSARIGKSLFATVE